MQKINPKIINSLSSEELTNLWNSGLGQDFCENNNKDIDVISIKNNIIYYKKRGNNNIYFSLFHFFISIIIFLLIYLIIDHVDVSKVGLIAIVSGVVCLIFILFGVKKILNSRKLFESATKLSNYDLSGFDIEDYAPNKKRLIHKSIEWGLTENLLAMENDKIKFAKTPAHRQNTKNVDGQAE